MENVAKSKGYVFFGDVHYEVGPSTAGRGFQSDPPQAVGLWPRKEEGEVRPAGRRPFIRMRV
jgi:hypothetical protein